jgi:anti-sigma factor ChrR (cupin superfamily)
LGITIHAKGHYRAGTLLASPPGSQHAVVSDEGCAVLAIRSAPIEFAAES